MKNNTSKAQAGASLIAPGTDRLITKPEAAERLGVKVRTVERLIAAGELQKQKIAGCVRLRLSQVLSLSGIEIEMITPQP
ncbi:MAG: helix-turn-helix domain-containing protein [Verrucomicrobiota bacterium]